MISIKKKEKIMQKQIKKTKQTKQNKKKKLLFNILKWKKLLNNYKKN